MKDIGVYSDVGLTNMLVKEFIDGHDEDFIPENVEIIKNVKRILGRDSFLEWSRQKCKDLFISISFRGTYSVMSVQRTVLPNALVWMASKDFYQTYCPI